MLQTQDLCRRMCAKNWREWRWALSFYDVENRLVTLCGTKRFDPFFRLHEAIGRYFRSAQVSLLLLLLVKYGIKQD